MSLTNIKTLPEGIGVENASVRRWVAVTAGASGRREWAA
jgi:hypothetical protein